MSVLADIQTALSVLGIPIETGVFTDAAPAKYIVVVPIADTFDLHADNAPGMMCRRLDYLFMSKATTWQIKMPL